MPKGKKKRENYFERRGLHFDELIWHALLGLWMLGIFIASGIEGSGEHYYDLVMLIERKGAHVFEFLVLAYLFWTVSFFYSLKFRQQVWLTFLFSFLYASWDEVHQLFVFGREGKILDVGIDLAGVILFIVLLQFVRLHRNKKPA